MNEETKPIEEKAQLNLSALEQRLEDRIDYVHDSLLGEQVKNARLPESAFIHYFLPYFSGQVESTEENKYVAHWISIAGSPTAEVDVFDTSGTIIFTVPPIFDTSHNNVMISERGKTVAAKIGEADLYGNISPVTRENMMTEVYGNILSKYLNTGIDQEKAMRWYEIFKRYNMVPDEQAEVKKVEEEANKLDPDEYTFD